jgi:hypothetical protein
VAGGLAAWKQPASQPGAGGGEVKKVLMMEMEDTE